jgi:hypothetical protein
VNYQLSFTELLNYDAGHPSITVPVTLIVSQARVYTNAKVDTGSSNCIFARNLGEELGIDIETGIRLLACGCTCFPFRSWPRSGPYSGEYNLSLRQRKHRDRQTSGSNSERIQRRGNTAIAVGRDGKLTP